MVLRVPARLFVEGTILEPGDAPIPGATKPSDLRAKYWDERTRSLVISLGKDTFAVGPDVLLGLSDTNEIALHVHWAPAGR